MIKIYPKIIGKCVCGCREDVVQKNNWYKPRFIMGHNSKGENNNMYGRNHTEETKQKIRLAKKGKKCPRSTKIKIINKIMLCKCGCGQETSGKYNSRTKKIAEYIYNHHSRGKNNPMYRNTHTKKVREKIKKNHWSKKTIEEVKKIKEGIIKNQPNRNGKNNPFYRKKHTLKNIKIIREARMKQVLPSKDTSIEVKIQNFLKKLHINFFTHHHISDLNRAYQCDIFIPKQNGFPQKTIIECDGCYWHGCLKCKLKTQKWTKEKRKKDRLRTKELISKGYKVIRLWEHEIRNIRINKFKEIMKSNE